MYIFRLSFIFTETIYNFRVSIKEYDREKQLY